VPGVLAEPEPSGPVLDPTSGRGRVERDVGRRQRPDPEVRPCLEGLGPGIRTPAGGRLDQAEVERDGVEAGSAQQGDGDRGRAAVRHRHRPGVADGVDDEPQQRVGLGQVDGAVAAEAGRRRHLRGQHRGQGRLVDLHHERRAREAPTQRRHVVAHPRRERVREVAPCPVVGQDLLAPLELDGRRQRPRSGHLLLDGALPVLGDLLEDVEVLREQGAGPTVVDPRGVEQTPPGGLEVGAQAVEHGERPADHLGGDATRRELGHEDEVVERAEHHRGALGVVLAGQGADAGRPHLPSPTPTSTRDVAVMVAEPTTRVPT
jgi:hypothetical protein